MKVKICGIRTPDEALRTSELGPDALGILVGFEKGIAPNVVSESTATQIVAAVKNLPLETFLLTDKNGAEINLGYAKVIGNTHLQLLGDISTDEIERIRKGLPALRVVKVIHITGYGTVNLAAKYEACDAVDELLLDSRVGYVRGGTGQTHDWTISRQIARKSKKPVYLAGGLKSYNLKEAIEIVRPYGVDVETGVQNPDGSKNYSAIREFIAIARSID